MTSNNSINNEKLLTLERTNNIGITPPKVPGLINNIKDFQKKISCRMERYKILDQIGQGSYAIVKLAFDKKESKYVAIKMYDKLKLMDP